MKILLSSKAEKQLRKPPKIDQIAVARKIRGLKDEDSALKIEKLRGFRNIFRVRVGNYRIVYKKTRQEIYIVLIQHRKEVYKLLKRLLG